jgi:type II secretory pathway component PulC
MLWLDYNIETFPDGSWRVEKEAFDKGLYKTGDVFIVDNNGILRKVDDLTRLIYNYENKDK